MDQHNTPDTFANLGLSDDITTTVEAKGYSVPTPIQVKAIPAILKGNDVLAAAQTGTGKTAGFTLPILDLLRKGAKARPNQARVLILTPTRELASQIEQNVKTYSAKLHLSSAVVFGGVNIKSNIRRLSNGADILVATPGRLLDLYQQKVVTFPKLEVLVLDEADRMLDMGFINDIQKIIATLPKKRQTLLFSATFSKAIRQLAQGIVHNPIEISVTPPNSTVESIDQIAYPVEKRRKADLLEALVKQNNWSQVLVFCRTKHGCDKLTKTLNQRGIKSVAIHGNKKQTQRTRALSQFKNKEVTLLVATDIAARGLDIEQLPQVVNVDLPNIPEDYVHRIGRTGRAGAKGHAVSFVSLEEFEYLVDIEFLIKKIIPRQEITGIPSIHLPASNLDRKPHFPKKTKGKGPGPRPNKFRGRNNQKRRTRN